MIDLDDIYKKLQDIAEAPQSKEQQARAEGIAWTLFKELKRVSDESAPSEVCNGTFVNNEWTACPIHDRKQCR